MPSRLWSPPWMSPAMSSLAASRASMPTAVPRWLRRAWIGLLVLCYTYVVSPANTNTLSRYDMVVALAQGTARIDALAANTIDLSYYQGHYYSPRSVGLSLLAVPVLQVFYQLERLIGQQDETMRLGVLNLICVVPVALAAVLVFERFLVRLRPSLAGLPALLVTSAFALGTLFYPFATVLFSHAFGGALVFIAFYLLYRARASPHSTRLLVAAGVLVGFGVISEYPTAVIAAVLVAYVWLTHRDAWPRALAWFGLGLVPAVLLLGWYNAFAFGNPLHMSYEYVAGSQFSGQHSGIFGITLPRPSAYVETLIWPRGLLVESPFLIFVPVGLYRWLRSSARPAPEALVCLGVCVLYPSLVASYFLPMAGENLPGPRLLVPALPFACLALGWVADDARRWVRALLAAGAAFGILLSYVWVLSGVREYHTYQTYPFTDLYWPILSTGYVPSLNGKTPPNFGVLWLHLTQQASIYLPLVPLLVAVVCGVVVWVRLNPPTSAQRDSFAAPARTTASHDLPSA